MYGNIFIVFAILSVFQLYLITGIINPKSLNIDYSKYSVRTNKDIYKMHYLCGRVKNINRRGFIEINDPEKTCLAFGIPSIADFETFQAGNF